jgi:uncharacterized protein YkwD
MPFPPPPPVAVAAQSGAEIAIVRQLNRVRRQHGLRALRVNRRLGRVARRHSSAMLRLNLLTHAPTLPARLSGPRRSRYGETLAWMPDGSGPAATRIVRLWLNSPGHRAVVLDGSLRRVGVGRVLGTMGPQRGYAVTADFSS